MTSHNHLHTRKSYCLNAQVQEHLDRMDTIGRCWSAISDILVPATDQCDMHMVRRENLSSLVEYLARDYQTSSDALAQALHGK